MPKGLSLGALAAAATTILAIGGPQAAPARSGFDGMWNVLVATEDGTCDRGYRYNLRIAGGAVHYEGDGSGIRIDVSGRVDRNGNIQVTISRGDQQASGTGRLSGERGAGRWTGRSPTAACSGRWEAEKRGA